MSEGEDDSSDELRVACVHVGDDDIDSAPNEIKLHEVQIPQKAQRTEIFTDVRLPCSAGKKRIATVEAKVDSGAGGNILPVRMFEVMYPDKLDSDGKPTSLLQTKTKLTAYDGGSVKCHGALHVRTEWDPLRGPPKYTQAVWYVADTQGPALLGLPSSE